MTVTAEPIHHAQLASVAELESAPFQEFMANLNTFAQEANLRVITRWSKVWEYPWLWAHALGNVHWTDKHLVDLGSEISPLPWFVATLGARVTLIETDPSWVPRWEALREWLQVDVTWYLVDSEKLPLADESADVVTSFSVIEHQPDKRRAVDEVARVLRPGGLLAVSFDICEPGMEMTFPASNGEPLTMEAFEKLFWRHPAFAADQPLVWNLGDIPEFLRWHLRSSAVLNYVTGAAALTRHA